MQVVPQLDVYAMEHSDSLYDSSSANTPLPMTPNGQMSTEELFMAPPPFCSNPNTPPHPHQFRNRIDGSKFKTKLCKNFLMGIPCPFEDRCAFAHNHAEQAQGRAMAAPPTPPSYNAFVQAASFESFNEPESCGSASASRPNTPPPPPSYPTRFRYDPYSTSGVVFAH